MGHTYTKKKIKKKIKKVIIDVKLKFNWAFLCFTSLRKRNMLFPGDWLNRMLAVLLKISKSIKHLPSGSCLLLEQPPTVLVNYKETIKRYGQRVALKVIFLFKYFYDTYTNIISQGTNVKTNINRTFRNKENHLEDVTRDRLGVSSLPKEEV